MRRKRAKRGVKRAILEVSWIYFELPLAKDVKTPLILCQFLRQLNRP